MPVSFYPDYAQFLTVESITQWVVGCHVRGQGNVKRQLAGSSVRLYLFLLHCCTHGDDPQPMTTPQRHEPTEPIPQPVDTRQGNGQFSA